MIIEIKQCKQNSKQEVERQGGKLNLFSRSSSFTLVFCNKIWTKVNYALLFAFWLSPF